jgi:hypothetical protein
MKMERVHPGVTVEEDLGTELDSVIGLDSVVVGVVGMVVSTVNVTLACPVSP